MNNVLTSLGNSIIRAKAHESDKRLMRDYPEIVDELNTLRKENAELKAAILEYDISIKQSKEEHCILTKAEDEQKPKPRGRKSMLDKKA